MPEGDTVWNTAQTLQRAIAGKRVERADFRVPRLATADLTDWTVEESASRGKHLLLRLTDPVGARFTLHSHLRMDGAWRVFAPGERWGGRPGHLIRVVLHTTGAVAVGYHLHELALVRTADEDRVVGHLGPDLLGSDWDPAEAVRRLRRRPERAIADALLDQRNLAGVGAKFSTEPDVAVAAGYWVPDEAVRRLLQHGELSIGEALLDQRNVAGIGTIYRAETLFLRGVHPWTPVDDVADLQQLLGLARRLMMANVGRRGPVITGDQRRGHRFWVYGRAREPCRRCGTPVRQGSLGSLGVERLIYWCPSCQAGDEP